MSVPRRKKRGKRGQDFLPFDFLRGTRGGFVVMMLPTWKRCLSPFFLSTWKRCLSPFFFCPLFSCGDDATDLQRCLPLFRLLRWHRGNLPHFLTTPFWKSLTMSKWKTTVRGRVGTGDSEGVLSTLIVPHLIRSRNFSADRSLPRKMEVCGVL